MYSCVHKFTYPLQNVQNVKHWNKIGGIIKIECYFVFSNVLNMLFHITYVYIYSTRQNNNRIYKNYPVQKFTHPWILILCVVSWMILDSFIFCDSCSWVGPEQRNHPASAHSLVFQHLLHIWTLSSSDCMILKHWGQLRDSNTTITKGENIDWCWRRQHNALRAGGCYVK